MPGNFFPKFVPSLANVAQALMVSTPCGCSLHTQAHNEQALETQSRRKWIYDSNGKALQHLFAMIRRLQNIWFAAQMQKHLLFVQATGMARSPENVALVWIELSSLQQLDWKVISKMLPNRPFAKIRCPGHISGGMFTWTIPYI
jgi:hypothetical protein